MAVSESRKKANLKWDAANLDRVSIAMPKGMKDTVKAAAAAAGGRQRGAARRKLDHECL